MNLKNTECEFPTGFVGTRWGVACDQVIGNLLVGWAATARRV